MSRPLQTILLVDDCAEDRSVLAEALASRYTVSEAGSLAHARQVMESPSRPDLVLTDIRLGDDARNRDGLILLRETRRTQPAIPVVVMTAFDLAQTIFAQEFGGRADAHTLGASAVLPKPVDHAELCAVLESALAARRRKWRSRIQSWAREWSPPLVVFVALLAAWEFCCRTFDVKEYLVPAPSRIAEVLGMKLPSLLCDTGITMAEAALGFFAANVLSLIIAIGFCHWAWLERSFYPYVIALKSVPVIAIAPLLVLWCGYGMAGKAVMAAIISFFPLVVNATLGLKSVDPEAMDLMHSLSASRLQILVKLRLPNALPYIFSALKISSALAVVGAVVGELTGAKRGIGFVILMASYNIDTPMLFAAIICASVAGILFFGAVAWIEVLLKRKYGFDETVEKEIPR